MTAHQLLHRSSHRFCIAPPADGDHIHHVVDRAAGGELVYEPELFLGKGQRTWSALLALHDPLNTPTRALGFCKDFGQSGNGRVFKQSLGLQIYLEYIPDTRYGLNRQQ